MQTMLLKISGVKLTGTEISDKKFSIIGANTLIQQKKCHFELLNQWQIEQHFTRNYCSI